MFGPRIVIVLRPRDIWMPRPVMWLFFVLFAAMGVLGVEFIGLLIVATAMMALGI